MKIQIATAKPFHPDAVKKIERMTLDSDMEFGLLEKYSEQSELEEAVKTADALIVRSDKITSDVLSHAKNLKVIVRAGAGYDNVDLKAAKEKGIIVMNTPGQNSNAVAELALGLMFFLARGKFSGKAGTELKGKSLGIHAYGNVGKHVARIAQGFGMQVSAFDAFVPFEEIEKDGIKPMESVQELYATSQYISLHIPSNEQTKESINYELLSELPDNAVLVNTARKEVINESELLKFMDERKDFSFISDIAPNCKDEIEKKYPDRSFFTPKKMGAQTAEANINAGVAAASQIINFFENNDTTFQVN
ncbi:MAG: 3-phosphoglycerate dehydrogenase [Bacteroidota bacterium]|nr:3-phosphoglycerate dehydrogenase [Bacteroidota bacterium]